MVKITGIASFVSKIGGTPINVVSHRHSPSNRAFHLQSRSPLPPISILKLDPLPPANVNDPAPVTAPLLLILLLGEPLPLRHAQILVRPVRIVVGAVRVRGHLRVHDRVPRHALEGHVLLLSWELGRFGCGGGGALAFCGGVGVVDGWC